MAKAKNPSSDTVIAESSPAENTLSRRTTPSKRAVNALLSKAKEIKRDFMEAVESEANGDSDTMAMRRESLALNLQVISMQVRKLQILFVDAQ